MPSLCAIVLTHNSSDTLEKCLESIKWITDIVIVDSGSTDKTIEIAKTYTDRIYYNKYINYGKQLNWALKRITSDWILVVDSDEALTEELSKNVRKLMRNRPVPDGYYIARKNSFLGKPVNYCGWYPDYVLRLFRQDGAVYKDRELGSSVESKGSKGNLNGDLIHQPYRNLEHYFYKFNKYTDLAAKEILKRKHRVGIFHLVLWPFGKFFKMYVLKKGFLDGVVGIVVCALGAFYVFSKYAKVWEMAQYTVRIKPKKKKMKIPKINNGEVKKIIIRSVNWIGDAVMTTPAIAQLAKNFPHAKITIVGKEWTRDVFIGNPFIDDIVTCNPKNFCEYIRVIKKLRKERFDIGIAFPNSFSSALLLFLTGAKYRVGYKTNCRGFLLNISTQRTKEIEFSALRIDYFINIVSLIGKRPANRKLVLNISEHGEAFVKRFFKENKINSADTVIGFNPGAAYGKAKCWPVKKYAELGKKLIKAYNAKLVLFGSLHEQNLVNAVARGLRNKCVMAAGKTTLRDSIGLVNKCKLFVTGDTGPLYIAFALMVPTLAIFGPTNPDTVTIPSEKLRVIYKKVSCSPCFLRECPNAHTCMEEVSVEEVFTEISKMMGEFA